MSRWSVLRAQGLRVVPGLPFVLALPLVVASCHRARPRLPAPSAIREFVVPWVNAFPSDIALDSAGRVWFTDRLTHRIGRLDPATGEIVGYATPASKSAPYGFAAGPDGGLWFAESGAGRVGRVDPSDGSITEYPLPGVTRGPHLLTWSGRRLWFTAREGRSWGWYEPVSGEGRVYPAPEGFAPYGIASGPDGSVWIGGQPGWLLLRVMAGSDTAVVIELSGDLPAGAARFLASLPDSVRRVQELRMRRSGQSRRIAVDAEGGVWLTDFGRHRVVRYDPRTQRTESFASLAGATEPYAIAVARDGLVWFSEKRTNAVVALDPASGERRTWALPTPASTVRQMALDEVRGRVWLPMSDAGRIGLIERGVTR